MSGWDKRREYIYNLPPAILSEFSRVMDSLCLSEWVRFASEILTDQTAVRLAERRERRTDWVMSQWENRNGTVGELIDLLERLKLLRPRDIILGWRPCVKSSCPTPRPPPSLPQPLLRPVCVSQFNPPPQTPPHPYTNLPTATFGTPVYLQGADRPLPKPGRPPSSLHSGKHTLDQQSPVSSGAAALPSGAMCWSYEEVEAGTENFSAARQIGAGGFGHVYRATVRNTMFAVKRLRQDSVLDWSVIKESFRTEVEKLSQYRHPNVVDLLDFSIGGDSFCLLYVYMENGSLEDQLHNMSSCVSWLQRVSIVEGSSKAVQYLHSPPDHLRPLIHGDIKSSNILLDQHLVPKLGDFGLARFSRVSTSKSASKTCSVAYTSTVRGTLPYLPDEYVQNGELGTAIDVYSFGVVLLEVLTGRRALEVDGQSRSIYLKDLVFEACDGDSSSSATVIWRDHLDPSLTSPAHKSTSPAHKSTSPAHKRTSPALKRTSPAHDRNSPGQDRIHQSSSFSCGRISEPGSVDRASGPVGSLQLAGLACWCLEKRKKKRPDMTEVFLKLQEIHNILKKTSSGFSTSSLLPPPPPPQQSSLRPPASMDSCVEALSKDLSRLEPLENTYHCLPLSSSSSSSSPSSTSSSFSSLPPSSSLPPHSSSLTPCSSSLPSFSSSLSSSSSSPLPPSSSLLAPCESDENQDYSPPQTGSTSQPVGNQFSSLPQPSRTNKRTPSLAQNPSPSPSGPTGNQYRLPCQPTQYQPASPSLSTGNQYNSPSQASRSMSPRRHASSGGAYPGAHSQAFPGPDSRGHLGAKTAGPHTLDSLGALKLSCPGAHTGSVAGACQMAADVQGPHPGTPGAYQGAPGALGPHPGTSGAYQGVYGALGPHPGTPGAYQGVYGSLGPHPGTPGAHTGSVAGAYQGVYGALGPHPVIMNPSKQRFLEKKVLYEEGRIDTPELLSAQDIYGGSNSDSRGPEESDEMDYLPGQPSHR